MAETSQRQKARRCAYHPGRAAAPDPESEDGLAHDSLGEYRMPHVGPLLLCTECVDWFDAEPFDHKEWSRG